MWLGVDDTDGPDGGCTTWVLTELARRARAAGLDLLGEPHLVRLNPNVPWKTRGNAALALRLGHGTGPRRTIGEVDGTPLVACARGRAPEPDEAAGFFEEAWTAVAEAASRAPGTDPALVQTERRLPATLYWDAVREVVRLRQVEPLLRAAGARYRVRGGRRGLIGAAAALAWPARRATWELIAYRAPGRIGTPRRVEAASVREATRREPELFLCDDPRTRRLLVAPHTACPILYGLRGRAPGAPLRARRVIRSEPVDRWMLFRTNQGSGDHLRAVPAEGLAAYRSGIVRGTVSGPPTILRGGHVRFRLRDRAGTQLKCLAFEPTKTLPAVARELRLGDRLRVWGSAGTGGALRLEGIVVEAVVAAGRWAAPECPECRCGTDSLGEGRGWRCARCGDRLPLEAGGWSVEPRALAPTTVHPTPSARRHLAPLPGGLAGSHQTFYGGARSH